MRSSRLVGYFIVASTLGCPDGEPLEDSGDTGPGAFECAPDDGEPLGDCSECIDEKCADLLPYCEETPECACMVECLRQEGMGGVDACLESMDLPYRPVGFPQLEECVAYACPDNDECQTPEDWVPPDADVVCDGLGSGGIGSGTGADCGFDATPFDANGDVLQLLSADGTICARVERQGEGSGTLENTRWSLLGLRIGPLGEVAEVTDETDLCWYSSHHNFQDWAHAWTGSRHYEVVFKEDGHGGPRRYHLYAYEQGPLEDGTCAPTGDGTDCIDGPISLYPYEP